MNEIPVKCRRHVSLNQKFLKQNSPSFNNIKKFSTFDGSINPHDLCESQGLC